MKNIIAFSKPAPFDKWEELSLPIGNSFMGAGFFGGISREKIVLNEKTLWTGGPDAKDEKPFTDSSTYFGGNKKNSYKYVKQAQDLLFSKKYPEAAAVAEYLTGEEKNYGAYQLLADLTLVFSNIDSSKVTEYRRSLDLDNALYNCSFIYSGAVHSRGAFANYPSNVIVIRLRSNKNKRVCVRLGLDNIQAGGHVIIAGNSLCYNGALQDNGLRYAAEIRAVGSIDGEIISGGNCLMIEHSTEVILLIAAATDYQDEFPRYRDFSADPVEIVRKRIDAAEKKGYNVLLEEHLSDYHNLYNRASLTLGATENNEIPQDCAMLTENYKQGRDCTVLEALYFQFGRYMLISSSRDGSLPANLQGVWNESNTPPWNCDYHININLQMNYWPAYVTNLAETAVPLIRFVDKMREPGRITAKEYYNIISDAEKPENGWIAHTAVNPFGWTAPGWSFYWGWSTVAAAWLMQNIWEYYEFTCDKDYLRTHIYPVMRESVVFYKQWLKFDKNQDRLVSAPSYSPEHGPVTSGNTYEQSLIEQLYKDFLTASEILDENKELRTEISEQLPLLKPYHISKNGLLEEWFEEDEPDFDNSKTQKITVTFPNCWDCILKKQFQKQIRN